MQRQDILNLLSLLGVQGRGGGKWIKARCPLAPYTHEKGKDANPSFQVVVDTISSCHCFACQFHGNLHQLVTQLTVYDHPFDREQAMLLVSGELDNVDLTADIPDYETLNPIPAPEAVWPETFLQSFSRWRKHPSCRKYLAKRRVTAGVADQLDLRYDTDQRRVCFPIRNWKGNLVGMHGRDITNTHTLKYYAYRYKGQYARAVWLGESWVDLDRPVLMVESVFDLAAVLPVFPNVVSPLAAGLSKDKLRRMEGCQNVLTLFDADDAGTLARKAISKWLPWANIQHLMPPPGCKDPGEASLAALTALLSDYKA